jgi:hypothetical protein
MNAKRVVPVTWNRFQSGSGTVSGGDRFQYSPFKGYWNRSTYRQKRIGTTRTKSRLHIAALAHGSFGTTREVQQKRADFYLNNRLSFVLWFRPSWNHSSLEPQDKNTVQRVRACVGSVGVVISFIKVFECGGVVGSLHPLHTDAAKASDFSSEGVITW